MMQHIATAKSEVAAFNKETGADGLAISTSNNQFDKILQEQKSHNSPIENHLYIPSPSSVKNESKVTAEEMRKGSSKALKEDVTPALDKNARIEPAEKVSNENLEEQNEIHSVLSDKSKLESTDKESAPDAHYCPYSHASETEVTLEPPSSEQVETPVPAVEVDSLFAEEWVELVGSLQKLAGEAESVKPSSTEANVIAKPEGLSDVDLDIENSLDISQAIIGQSADKYVAETISTYIQLAVDEVQADVQAYDSNAVVSEVQKEAQVVGVGNSEIEQIVLNIDGGDVRVQQKTLEKLLNSPDVLQELATHLDSGDQGKQTAQPLDITTNENKALLSSILVAPELAISKLVTPELVTPELVTPELVKSEIEQKAVKASSTILDSKIGNEFVNQAQTKQTEALLAGVAPEVASAIEIAEQVTEQEIAFIQPKLSTSVDSPRADKTVKNTDIKVLLGLPESKLEKVLDSIAQRILDKSSNEPTVFDQVQTVQQVGNTRAAEIISSNDLSTSTKELVGALKSGLEEFKNQLAQGREPGIDLKSLITDALSKTGDETAFSTAKVSSEQFVNGISQVLNFANSLNQAIEQNQNQTYNATLRDVAQIQGEQTKQAQLTPFESKFEKAVNIAKPEGHQQLAEKVRWMVNTKNLVAEIRLDPAELGSMHVKVAVSGESATVNFVVQSQQARDAVDTATPRLKEMLAEKGIELGQSSVEQESRGQQQGESESGRGNNATSTSVEEAELAQQSVVQQKIVNGALGGIDYFV